MLFERRCGSFFTRGCVSWLTVDSEQTVSKFCLGFVVVVCFPNCFGRGLRLVDWAELFAANVESTEIGIITTKVFC